jgi:predicted phage-related endonuclease
MWKRRSELVEERVDVRSNTEKWYDVRRGGPRGVAIGASEVLDVVGVSGARGCVNDKITEVVQRMRGQPLPQEEDAHDKPWFRHGHACEEWCAREYAKRMGGVTLRETSVMYWRDARVNAMMRATPDRGVWPPGTPPHECTLDSMLHVLECKAPYMAWHPPQLRDAYLLQVHHQMLCSGQFGG